MGDTAILDGILKDVFEDFVSSQVNDKNPLVDLFKPETIPHGGREVKYATKVGRNASPMFVGEDSAFATAGAPAYVQFSITTRKAMGRIRLTAEVIDDTSRGEYAYKQALKEEMKDLIDNFAKRQEFALATDGRGILALIDEADPDGDQTLELDAPGGVTNDNFGNRYCQPGMVIAAINPATGQPRAVTCTITACNEDGTDVTVNTAGGAWATAWANSDYIVQAAADATGTPSVNDTSWEKAWWGLLALVDDGTYRDDYFGVSRTQYPNLKSYVRATTGALSLDGMQLVSDVVEQKLGGRIDLVVAHHSTRRTYLQLLEADRRYQGGDLQSPDGGTKAFKQQDVTFGGVPFRAIKSFPLDIVMFLDKGNSGFVQYVSEAGKWEDRDGAVLVRDGTGSSARHAFEGWYYMRKQFHARYPGYNARMDGVTGQTLVVVRDE